MIITKHISLDEVTKAIKSRPVFWKAVINRHLLSNYNLTLWVS